MIRDSESSIKALEETFEERLPTLFIYLKKKRKIDKSIEDLIRAAASFDFNLCFQINNINV